MTWRRTANVAPILALLLAGAPQTGQGAPSERAADTAVAENGPPCPPVGPALEPAFRVPQGLRLVVETLQARFSCEAATPGYWRMTITRAGSVVSVTSLPVYSELRDAQHGGSVGTGTGRWLLEAEDGYWQVATSPAGPGHDVTSLTTRPDPDHAERTSYSGLAAGPWVLEPGEQLYLQAGCAGVGGSGDPQLFARGSLQSVDGPGTAP